MRTISIALLLLAACSGGGGATWSADLSVSHPYLPGMWSGLAKSTRVPSAPAVVVHLTIGDVAASDRSFFPLSGSFGGQCATSVPSGQMRAIGDRVQITSAVAEVLGDIQPASAVVRIVGTYRVLQGACATDEGTIDITRTASLPSSASTLGMTIEQFSTPDLFVQIVTVDGAR